MTEKADHNHYPKAGSVADCPRCEHLGNAIDEGPEYLSTEYWAQLQDRAGKK